MNTGLLLRQTTKEMIRTFGETFDIVRGDSTHRVRGSKHEKKRTIAFLHDADVQAGDVARSPISGVSLYVMHIEHDIVDDVVVSITAQYETDYSRARRQVASAPSTTITIGAVYSSVLNIQSQLNQVTQQIAALSQVDTDTKQALTELVAQLQEALRQTPPEHAADAELVTKRVDAVVQEAAAAKPDTEVAAANLESLKKAATNLAAVLPAVLPIAMQIIDRVRPLVGL